MYEQILNSALKAERITNESLDTNKKVLNRINEIKQLFGLIPPNGTFQINVTEAELEILLQSLTARKKLLRGKIRNNEGHMTVNDRPDWTEADYLKAIKRRKLQLADTDMLKTRLENL